MTKILDLRPRLAKSHLSRGRRPLASDNFGETLHRIKDSLERINALMSATRENSSKVFDESADKINMATKQEPT